MLALSFLIASQSRTVQAESIGTGKPMVAIPGGPGFSGRSLWGIGFGMRGSYKTYLFDQAGTGSNTNPTISLDGTIQDLETLRKRAGHKKWVVLGQSWGVIVALVYAARHPEVVDHLILTSVPGLDMDGYVLQQNLDKKIPKDVEKGFIDIELDPNLTPEEKLVRQVPPLMPYYFHTLEVGQETLRKAPANLFAPQVFLALQKHILTSEAYRADLKKLRSFKAPVTMIQGHQDPCGSAMPYLLKERCLPRAKVALIPNCGHFPWIEHPSLFFGEFHEALKLKFPDWLDESKDEGKALSIELELRQKNNWPFGPDRS